MNKYSIFFACLAFVLSGCMKDLGNYEYADRNTITISEIEELYLVDQFDTLIIQPKLSFSEENAADLSYDWRINYRSVSDLPNLNKPISSNLGRWPAGLIVTDNKTGVKAFYDFEVEISSPYDKGLFILSEDAEGNARLSFQRRRTRPHGAFMLNIFERDNPEFGSLGKRPQQLAYLRIENSGTFLAVLCKEGDKKIAKLDMKTMEYRGAVNENLVLGGEYAGTFEPTYLRRYYPGVGIVSGGRFFSYNNAQSELLYRPVQGDYNLADYITANESFAGTYWLGYDKDKCCFVTLSSGSNIYDFSDIKFWTFDNVSTAGMKFVRGEEHGGVNYADYPAFPQKKQIVLSENNRLHFYELTLSGVKDTPSSPTRPELRIKLNFTSTVGDENSAFAFGPNSSYWFISSGKNIYRVHAGGSNPELWYTVAEGEIKVMKLDSAEKNLFVALKTTSGNTVSGDVMVLDAGSKNTLLEPVYKNASANPVDLYIK